MNRITVTSLLTVLIFLASCKKNDDNPVTSNDNVPSSWSRLYGGNGYNEGDGVQPLSDGNYIVLGWTSSTPSGSADFWLLKLNNKGDTIWTRTFGGSDWDYGQYVRKTSDGGFILIGYTRSFGAGASDAWLIKTDAQGNQQWAKTYGGPNQEAAKYVQQTSDGGYILCGSFEPGNLGQGNNPWLIRTDGQGNKLWDKYYTYDASTRFSGTCVQQTTDGGFVALSTCNGGVSSIVQKVWMIKTTASGDTSWTRLLPTTDSRYSATIKQLSDGSYILVADKLLRLDSSGNLLWTKDYAGSDVQVTTDGGFIIIGNLLMKTDSYGNLSWSKSVTGTRVEQANDGGYILVGRSSSDKIIVTKTDKDGNVQ